ncbi:WAPL (Wings apart-like protein regulation of heterochromatin) protein [Klebsormidium nitens]|uniref:WAPL (Wings apart-like protein regulation of heterochromatin) protein n=1 Tax=Klebsormidium nitens TaxID=105231 RepID=A0A1Y1HWR7_KLENI|nr:WAPL (Wings apart-like protein regulation of heterochromatin) protein [Klebsormidium nitens]|eukprot:GAQ83094.1 WAPL (Wings apart-like protein regulation of heterochromatin) protein [Klebsormidium nitens]
MIRTYQRRNKGGSNSQPDAFSPFESDSQDLIGSYHSQLSSQEGNAALNFSDPIRTSQQPPVNRLGSLSSRLDLFAFEDDEEEDAFGQGAPLERQDSALTRRGSQGGSPAKKPPHKHGGTAGPGSESSLLGGDQLAEQGLKGGLTKSPLLAGSFGRGVRHFSTALQSSSLMEHQESGEMQESVDEAKFALEGLTPRSSPRVLRASLVALSQLLSTSARRRVLQAHGLGKPLLTAITTLPPSAGLLRLASAAIVYFLAVDDLAHRSLLDSDDVIRLVLGFLEGESGGGDGGKGDKVAVEQARRVQELFRSGGAADVGLIGGGEVSPAWLGLLALEQASMAAAQLQQEASIGGAKSANRFKDRLREQGGLATICHLAAACQAALHDDVSGGSSDVTRGNDDVSGRPAAMLLRCLRVLEHVTYVSEENQQHLLQLRISERGGEIQDENGGREGGADTCVDVVLGCIEALGLGGEARKLGGSKILGKRSEVTELKGKAEGNTERSGSGVKGMKKETLGSEQNIKESKLVGSAGASLRTDSKRDGAKTGEPKREAEAGAAKPLGKWQSAAKVKRGGSRTFREDEVIPDSDEENASEKERKDAEPGVSGQGEKGESSGGERVAGAESRHVAEERSITRRASGRIARVGSGVRKSEEMEAMDIVRESGVESAVGSGDVMETSRDVSNRRSDTEENRPPIVRTFSRKKRKVDNGGVEEMGNGGGGSQGNGGTRSKGDTASQISDPFEFVDEETEGSQQLSSQNSGQLREKRKFAETSAKRKAGLDALSRGESLNLQSSQDKGENEKLDRRSSWNGKRKLGAKAASLKSEPLGAFDFEITEDDDVPALGAGLEKHRRAGDLKVKQETIGKPAFDFDEVDEKAAPSSQAAEPLRRASSSGRRLARVREEVKANPALERKNSRGVRNEASAGTRAKEEPALREKTAARAAFSFNPIAEKRERKGLNASRGFDANDEPDLVEMKEKVKGPRRDLRQALDKGLVTECLVTSVKVLMNLTNDNADGCRQIAAAGGLHSVASLLVSRCPPLRTGHRASVANGDSTGGSLETLASGEEKVQGRNLKTGARKNGKGNAGDADRQLAPELRFEGGSEAALIGAALPNTTPEGGDVSSTAPRNGRATQGAAKLNASVDDVSKHDDVSMGSGNGAGREIVAIGEGPSEDLDLVTVVLALLINLVEKDRKNRAALAALEFPRGRGQAGEPLEGAGMVTFLCALFLSKKGAGAKAESVENQMAAFEMDDETRLLEGQREAEDMIVEAYAALLLALLAKDDLRARTTVAESLPEGDASSLVPVLERFMNFHLRMNSITREAHEALLDLIGSCKQQERPPA